MGRGSWLLHLSIYHLKEGRKVFLLVKDKEFKLCLEKYWLDIKVLVGGFNRKSAVKLVA